MNVEKTNHEEINNLPKDEEGIDLIPVSITFFIGLIVGTSLKKHKNKKAKPYFFLKLKENIKPIISLLFQAIQQFVNLDKAK